MSNLYISPNSARRAAEERYGKRYGIKFVVRKCRDTGHTERGYMFYPV